MSKYHISKLPFMGINPGIPAAQSGEMSFLQAVYALMYKIDECIDTINTLANIDPVAKSNDMTSPVGLDDDGKLWAAPADLTAYATKSYVDVADTSLNNAKQDKRIISTVTLPLSGWVNNQITVSKTGITNSDRQVVTAAVRPEDKAIADEAGIYLYSKSSGILVFKSEATPRDTVIMNIVIDNGCESI